MPQIPIDVPRTIRQGEELDQAKLQSYLNQQVKDFGQITEISQFPGGYSNLTYLLKTPRQEYVLRRPPFGAKDIKGGHDMGREFRVLSLLQQAGYQKMPPPVVYCQDESVIGCPFYVMQRVQGIILRAHSAPKMGIDSPTMQAISEALVDNMVALHGLDIHTSGLIQLGKPEGYIRRQVEGWAKRYQNAQTDSIKAMEALAAWLHDHLPAENPPTLIHNDYKHDNVVLNHQHLPSIIAVLDWEMATVGDPLMDVGTSLSYWAEPNDSVFERGFNLTWLPGNLTRQQFASRYAEKSGRDLTKILYYYVFGLFKNAVVAQQIYARYKKGLTQDERFAGLIAIVNAFAHKGITAIETQKI